jgi:hypothetical protein
LIVSRFGFELPHQGRPWPYVLAGVSFVALGVSALVKRDWVMVGYIAFGMWYLAMGVYRFVDRRAHPEDPSEGMTRTTSDAKELTITGIDGDTVRCSRFDPQTGKTDAWVGSWSAFEDLTTAATR